MAKKIDPLNWKNYSAVSVSLAVTDVKRAIGFYQKAFGFQKRGLMSGPNGKPIHGELTLRGITLMPGPEMPGFAKSAKTFGGSPVSLYLLVEDADKVFAKAIKQGATPQMPVTDMFWCDRWGSLIEPEGYRWSVATHAAEPTPREMNKEMKKQVGPMTPSVSSGGAAASDSEYDGVAPRPGRIRPTRPMTFCMAETAGLGSFQIAVGPTFLKQPSGPAASK
jgi:uncharacterized glyoxalase superfamily protein PhnB